MTAHRYICAICTHTEQPECKISLMCQKLARVSIKDEHYVYDESWSSLSLSLSLSLKLAHHH